MGFGVWGLAFGVWGLGFVLVSGTRPQGLGGLRSIRYLRRQTETRKTKATDAYYLLKSHLYASAYGQCKIGSVILCFWVVLKQTVEAAQQHSNNLGGGARTLQV